MAVKSFKYSLLAATIASYLGAPAFAADSPALEEVVVTAQKRAQNQQEVPISMNTLSGAKLEEAGITSIQGISDYVPSFNMTQTGIGTNIAIRGISSGVNQGFEQSAAEFVDGVHYGRSQLARAPFLDIDRIEVLRGPQSILFGKNSTAGAVSISTAKPTDKFEGSLTTLYEPEYGERDARLVLSGPISDTVSGRVALMSRSYDGFIENTTLNQDEAAEKDRVVRVSFAWKPTDDLNFNLKMEDGMFDSVGRNIETIKPVTNSALNPTNDPNPYKTVLSFLTAGKYSLDTTLDGKRQSNGDYSNNDTENVTFTIDYDFNDLKLTSVTGYNAYVYSELCDCDFTGAPGFNIYSDENYRQVSQELRLASSEKQTVSWIGGIFYQGSKIKFHDNVFVPTNSVIATALSSSLLRGASTQRDFNQETNLSAVFAQATWHFTDDFRAIFGGRYSQETKDADRHQYHVSAAGVAQPEGAPTDPYNLLWRTFKVVPHTIKGSLDESGFNPQFVLQYDFTANNHAYASYTTGFKSGGFDVRSNAPDATVSSIYPTILGTWQFKQEDVKNYEVGGKFLLLDGIWELNASFFREEFSKMQTSQFDGSLSFNVTNAGEAVVQGLEVDSRFAIMDNLLMRGGFSYIDFEYTNFKNGQCYFGQADNIAPIGDGVCDATGMRREFVPKLQGNLGWDYKYLFTNGLKISTTLDIIYSDSYLTTPSLDPRMEQDAYTKINARIALAGNENLWELALIGKNLTDQTVITYANGLPVASTLTKGAGSGYYAFFSEPRSVSLQATLKF